MTTTTIKRDARVIAADGEAGRVKHLIVDRRSGDLTHLVISHDGSEWLVPVAELARVEPDYVVLFSDRHTVTKGDVFRTDDFCPAEAGGASLPPMRSAERGGATLLQAKDTEPQAELIPEKAERSTVDATVTSDEAPYRLQLQEERLKITVEPYQSGAVRFRTTTRQRVERVDVPLREEWLIVEVEPGAGPVRVGDRLLEDGGKTEILLREERPVVHTEVLVHEEVSTFTEVLERVESLQTTLRREELTVETEGDLAVTDEPPTTAR